jgi:hypothetical protein
VLPINQLKINKKHIHAQPPVAACVLEFHNVPSIFPRLRMAQTDAPLLPDF